jgi:serine/threonine-protein kinase HipA
MNRCPITYLPCGENHYSEKGLKLLAPGLSDLKIFEYTSEEQRIEAFNRASKMSIQGVQPKLSAILNQKNEKFEIVDKGGKYILKPQHHLYFQMPENEDLTMRLAELIKLEVPIHGLILAKDNSLTYFIKRFDRKGQNDKIAVEDFAQLSGLDRDTKYDYSMEKVVLLIKKYCTFPAIENAKLFKMTLFNFLVGNEDMHVKNFSIIYRDNKLELSPCYDLLNSTIEIKKQEEEIALPLKGKKKHLTRNVLIDYFGKEKCELTNKVIDKILETLTASVPLWLDLINISFLSDGMKKKYLELLNTRLEILKIR